MPDGALSQNGERVVYSEQAASPMPSSPRYRTVIGAASLVVAPALMSIGDLMHPPESWDPAVQMGIVAAAPQRWYTAHLLLLIGLLLFVPGILALTDMASRKPRLSYAGRVLTLAGIGALSAVITHEMLLGRFVSDGADRAAAVALFMTGMSGPVFGALLPGLLAFFVGIGLTVAALVSSLPPLRWPALLYALGAA